MRIREHVLPVPPMPPRTFDLMVSEEELEELKQGLVDRHEYTALGEGLYMQIKYALG